MQTSGYDPTEANIARHSALVDFLNTIWIEHITQNLGNRAQDRYELTRVKQGGRPLTRTVTRARKEKEKETKDVAFPLTLRMLSIGYLEVGSKEVVHYREDTAHFEPWHIVASMTTESKILSELSIEQILGGKVRSTFFTPTCVVTRYASCHSSGFVELMIAVSSDLKTPSIEVLQMSPGRDPRPDLALVYRNEAYAHLKLAPVFSVAEVKRVKTGAGKKETPEAPSFQAQIQSAIYPTLIMLSLFHTSAELNEEFQTDDELPEHYFIYGIYLDEAQIKIYAHFPFYSTQESGWRFAQVEMADLTLPSYGTVTEEPSENAREYFNHREQENAILRWQLIQALLTTRAHTSELVRLFKENDEPKWIKLCELYEQTNQGNSATQSGHAQTLAEYVLYFYLRGIRSSSNGAIQTIG